MKKYLNDTLKYYETNARSFFEDTVKADMSGNYGRFLEGLPKGGRILDLGCGSGRDSLAFMKKGYEVTALDGAKSLCERAETLLGKKVLCMDFSQMDFREEFHGVWACASLLHVKREELPGVLGKAWEALLPEGSLYASFKYGKEERFQNGRYFNDCMEKHLPLLFKKSDGWAAYQWYITQDVRPGREQEKWLNIIAKKQGRGEAHV